MTAWLVFALGLLLGFLIGVVFHDAYVLIRDSRRGASIKEVHHVDTARWGRLGLSISLVAAVLLQFVVGVLLIQARAESLKTQRELAEYTECTTAWRQQFATAFQARVDAQVQIGEALDQVFAAAGVNDDKALRAAIAEYNRVRREQVRERESSPIPPLPNELCGPGPAKKDS